MKTIRALFIAMFMFSGQAIANTFGTDYTDIWWNPNESGWGVTASHQGEIVFLTFFVYGTNNQAIWYTGQATFTSNTNGQLTFIGPVYQTTGPWLGTTPFNPSTVGVVQVGTVNFTAGITSGTLTYSINGVVVNKAITRQTFRNNNLTGTYIGEHRLTNLGCINPANNGTVIIPYVARISHSGASLLISLTDNNGVVCTVSGNYTQAGRMGASTGTSSCTGSTPNGYSLFEVEATVHVIHGRYSLSGTSCTSSLGSFAYLNQNR